MLAFSVAPPLLVWKPSPDEIQPGVEKYDDKVPFLYEGSDVSTV